MMRVAVISVILFSVWLVLSGRFDLLHVGLGIVSAVAVAINLSRRRDHRTRFRPVAFLLFLPWLAWQVVLSNLRVAALVFQRRMPIHPTFIGQRPGVVGNRALTGLATGITLTPGTLTIDVTDDYIEVHALDVRSAADVRAGLMAARLARAFEDRSG